VPEPQPDQCLGLNVPYEWWPAAALVKSFEAAGFGWTQVPAPPPSVLADPRACLAHARALADALDVTALKAVVHGPSGLVVGSREADRVFEGLLSYAAEAGARIVVYHARNFPDAPASEDRLLAETRSLARQAPRAERLGLLVAIENLAPVFTGPEQLGHTPMVLRTLARRISSRAIGVCLDVGHAHIVADLRHSDACELIQPVLDSVVLFHLHDNFGARRVAGPPPELDPLRLDLHLSPGRGTVPWSRLSPLLRDHPAPLLLEVHPQQRPEPAKLFEQALAVLSPQPAPAAA
jgi:sugar phosphate isomerase/epimerase